MSFKTKSQLINFAHKEYSVPKSVMKDMCNRGFFVPIPNTTNSSDEPLYDGFFVEEKTAFQSLFKQYEDTKDYLTSAMFSQKLSEKGVNIPAGAIESMAKLGLIDAYKVTDNYYLFKPDLLINIEPIRDAYKEFEELENEELFAEVELEFPDEEQEEEPPENVTEENGDAPEEEIFLFEEEEDKKAPKKKKHYDTTPTPESFVPPEFASSSQGQTVIDTATAGEGNSKPSYSATSNTENSYSNHSDEAAKKAYAERQERRIEEEKKAEEERKRYEKSRNEQPETKSQGTSLRDEQGHITFSGYKSEKNDSYNEHQTETPVQSQPASFGTPYRSQGDKPSHSGSQKQTEDFMTKVQISAVATQNTLSQNALNEIIEYSRKNNQEIKVPMRDGSYLKVEPVATQEPVKSDAPQKSDYRVSVVSQKDNSAKTESTILYSSVLSENQGNFASVSETYAKGMGVKELDSGYKNEQQEKTDAKVLYAIGVVPSNQTFAVTAPDKKPQSEQKDFTTVVLPSSVEYVHPSIVSRFEREGIKYFSSNDEKINVESFNKNQVNERSIDASAYLGSDEQISRELSKINLSSAVSNAVSEKDYRAFAERVKIAEIASDTTLSQDSINHIIDIVRTENRKIDVPLYNNQLMTFEPVKSETNPERTDFRVVLSSPSDGDYSKPKRELLYSSEAKEQNAVNIGAVYSSYAKGMGTNTLESKYNDSEKMKSERQVLYAIGAVSKGELSVKDGTLSVPKEVKYVNPAILKNAEVAGAVNVSIDSQKRTIEEYRERKITLPQDDISESVYVGSYKTIEKMTAKAEVSEDFKQRYNIKSGNRINGIERAQINMGSISDTVEGSKIRGRHREVRVAAGIAGASVLSASSAAKLDRAIPGSLNTTNTPARKIYYVGNLSEVVNDSRSDIKVNGTMRQRLQPRAEGNVPLTQNGKTIGTETTKGKNGKISNFTVSGEKVNMVSPVIINDPQKKNIYGKKDNAVLIPTKKGFLLSYSENGKKTNITMIGSLQDDKNGFKPAKQFGIERQIRLANSRTQSAMPYLVSTIGKDNKIHLTINPELVQNKHGVSVYFRTQQEIIRLAGASDSMPAGLLKDPELLEAARAGNILLISEKAKEMNAEAEAELEEEKEVSPIINKGMRYKENKKQERINLTRGTRGIAMQLGRLSGLTQGRDSFTVGAKTLFGYTAPINVIADLARRPSFQVELENFEKELMQDMLVDDLKTLAADDIANLDIDVRQVLGRVRLNRELGRKSYETFGKNITRFSTYQLKNILKKGKYNGQNLTAEQRQQLLVALKLKGYSIRDFTAFSVSDNLKRHGITLSRNYDMSKMKDLKAMLKELDDISASERFRSLFNGVRLSEMSRQQLSLIIDNKSLSEDVRALAQSYLKGEDYLKKKRVAASQKRGRFSRVTILARRLLAGTDAMAGINAVIMPIEYARLAISYGRFMIALQRSIFGPIKKAYKRALLKLWRRLPVYKFVLKYKEYRTVRKTTKAYNRAAKRMEKNYRRMDRRAKIVQKRKALVEDACAKHPKINKAASRINKTKGKIKTRTAKIGRGIDKVKAIGSKFSNAFAKISKVGKVPMKIINAPLSLYNKLKDAITEKILLPILKYALIFVIGISLLEGTLAVVDIVMSSAQSIIWNFGETDSEEDTQDDLDLTPEASLMRDRTNLCIGLDSALKIYTEVMCDANSYDTSIFGESTNTAIKSVLESDEVKKDIDAKRFFDPKENKYVNVENLGCKIDGIQTGIHYSYYDGDGNEIGLQSNAKDIMAVANAWMWENYYAKGLFKSYVEKLWNYSHAVAYNPRKYPYYNESGTLVDGYVHECNPDDPTNPCHNDDHIYKYKCNDDNASIYELQSDGTYKIKNVSTNDTIIPYNKKGCKEHTITYHGGKGACFSSRSSLRGCSNIKSVSIPSGTSGWKTVYFCGGCSDCTSECRGSEKIQTSVLYHDSFETRYKDGKCVYGPPLGLYGEPASVCSCWSPTLTYTMRTTETRLHVPADCYTASEGWPICSCGENGESIHDVYTYTVVSYTEYYTVTCTGHTTELDMNICNGYCDGHELRYCSGHIDLDISMVTLFLDDENGLTKLGVPTSVTKRIETVKDSFGEESLFETETPTTPFVPLYKSVDVFKTINTSLPLPDSESIKKEVKLKLEGLLNVAVGSNETVDTLRFFWMFKEGKMPYEDSNKTITNMDDLMKQYFIQFETCKWQDTNDQGSLDASGIFSYATQALKIGHLSNVYEKFLKTNEFEGWYSFDDDTGKIETVEVKIDDRTKKTAYIETGNVSRAEAMLSDDWKELYDIDFPGAYKGAIEDKDKTLLLNKVLSLHGEQRSKMAEEILNRIGKDNYDSTPGGCVAYVEELYKNGFGRSPAWGKVPAGTDPKDAVKYIYSTTNGSSKVVKPLYTGDKDSTEAIVAGLQTGDCVFIGDEIYVVLYNNYNEIDPKTGKIKGTTASGQVVFATAAGGGPSRLVAFNTESLTKNIGFGYVKYS